MLWATRYTCMYMRLAIPPVSTQVMVVTVTKVSLTCGGTTRQHLEKMELDTVHTITPTKPSTF